MKERCLTVQKRKALIAGVPKQIIRLSSYTGPRDRVVDETLYTTRLKVADSRNDVVNYFF
jgi:hypothetical protein